MACTNPALRASAISLVTVDALAVHCTKSEDYFHFLAMAVVFPSIQCHAMASRISGEPGVPCQSVSV